MFISNTLSQGTVEKNGEIVEIFLKMQKKVQIKKITNFFEYIIFVVDSLNKE